MQYEIVFAFFIIISIALLPILSWEKTRPTGPFVGILYLLFIYIHQDFALGKITATHDTYWGYTHFYSFIRQWIVAGVPLGWNPYMGGGQPVYLFSNYFIHSPVFIFAKLFLFLGWHFSNEQFFSLVWVLNHLWICTGIYLLLYLLLNSLIPSLFGMITLLLGGFFSGELASPNGFFVLIFLPYLLFSIISFWKYEKWFGMYLFFALLGLAINYNNPAYLFICLIVLLFSYLLVNVWNIRKIIDKLFTIIKAKPYSLLIGAILFILPALPLLYLYHEIGDYVSPTRGFTVIGQTVSNTGFQPSAVASLKSYEVLYNGNINEFFLNTHTSFYIGSLSCLILLFAPFLLIKSIEFRKRTGVFLISAAFLALIGAGNSSPIPVWSLLENVPLFNMCRHTFPFAKGVTFLLIIISSESLLQLLKIGNFSWLSLKAKLPLKNFTLFFLFAFHLAALTCFSNSRIHNLPVNSATHPAEEKLYLKEFSYPSEWYLHSRKSSPIPYDFTGIIEKESILANADAEFNFMVQKNFIPFLRNLSREEYYNDLFIPPLEFQPQKKDLMLPGTVNSATSDIYRGLGFRRINTYSPIYATVESSSAEGAAKNIYKAVDGDFNSYWHVAAAKKKDSFTWLSITFPSEVKIYGIRITPHKIEELWSGNKAEIQTSKDGKRWEPIQKLDLRTAIVNRPNLSFLFPFNTSVTARYFRLWVDDEKFTSLTEIELIDEPIIDTNIILPSKKMDILNISNAVVNASSRYLAHTENLAFDGNINTFWHVNMPAKDWHWISIKFPVRQTFNGVQFIPRQDENQMWDSYRQMECKVELQMSADGKNWRSVSQRRSGYGKTFLFSLKETVTAEYVRLFIRDKSRKFLSVAEIQFVRLAEDYFEDASPLFEVGTVSPLESKDPNEIYLKINAEKDGNLVRLENYHRGWRVFVDKKEVDLQKFGPNLQLIPIPAGEHEVHLEFYSWYNTLAWLHVWFSLFVFLGFVVWLANW